MKDKSRSCGTFLQVPKRNAGDKDQPEHFQGVLSDESTVTLTAAYVRKTFPPGYVEEVIKEATNDNQRFIFVPPGAPRTMDGHMMLDDRFPELKYMQGSDFTCLFSSFASALHYIGLRKTAKDVADFAKTFSAQSKLGILNWKGLNAVMEKSCSWLIPKSLEVAIFDVLTETSEFPTVMSLEAEDGSTQHAITVVGNLIFDSNIQRAIPLTRSNLNYCCSTEALPNGVFKKVFFGYRYEEHQRSKKKLYETITKKNNVNFFMDESFDDDE